MRYAGQPDLCTKERFILRMVLYIASNEWASRDYLELPGASIFERRLGEPAPDPAAFERFGHFGVHEDHIAGGRVPVLEKREMAVDPRFKAVGQLVVFNLDGFQPLLLVDYMSLPQSSIDLQILILVESAVRDALIA